MCHHFLVLTFVCSWFGSLFAKYATFFVGMKRRKRCLLINLLLSNGVNTLEEIFKYD